MSEPITVAGRETMLRPRPVRVKSHVYPYGVVVKLDDSGHDEFWLNIHIPKDIVLAWANELQEMENDKPSSGI